MPASFAGASGPGAAWCSHCGRPAGPQVRRGEGRRPLPGPFVCRRGAVDRPAVPADAFAARFEKRARRSRTARFRRARLFRAPVEFAPQGARAVAWAAPPSHALRAVGCRDHLPAGSSGSTAGEGAVASLCPDSPRLRYLSVLRSLFWQLPPPVALSPKEPVTEIHLPSHRSAPWRAVLSPCCETCAAVLAEVGLGELREGDLRSLTS